MSANVVSNLFPVTKHVASWYSFILFYTFKFYKNVPKHNTVITVTVSYLRHAGSGWRSRWPARGCALEDPTWAGRRCWSEAWPGGEAEDWEAPPSQWQTVWQWRRRYPGRWRRGIGNIRHRPAAAGWSGERRGSESSPALSSEDARRPSARAEMQPENPSCYTRTSPCSPERARPTQEVSQSPEGLKEQREKIRRSR